MARAAEFRRWLQRASDDAVAFGCAIKLTRDRHRAEDLVQEAYLRALQHQDEIEDENHLRHWLCTVVVNLARDHGRRKQNHTRSLPDEAAILDGRPSLLDVEARDYVTHYLAQLPSEDRRLIEIKYFEVRTLEEIHALYPEWGSIGTLSKRITAICDQLRELMSQVSPSLPPPLPSNEGEGERAPPAPR
jgi:RNA polymerase sigma-70 factor (ECF subfamily)